MKIIRIIDFLFLLFPFAYLGLRHFYIAVVDNPEYKIRKTTAISLILYVFYISFLIGIGPASMENHLSDYEKGKSMWTYLIPGFGCALAAFPYEASEFSKDFVNITIGGINDIFAVFGWFLIFIFLMKLTIFSV